MQPEPTSTQYVWKDDYFCPPHGEAFPVREGFFFRSPFQQLLVSNPTIGEIDPEDKLWLNVLPRSAGMLVLLVKDLAGVRRSEPILVGADWEMLFNIT